MAAQGQISDLVLTHGQVIVDRTDEQLGVTVMSIRDVVKHELCRRRSEPSYRAEVYYSVQQALGEGPEDWTEQELAKIKRRAALERELAQQYGRLGAFTLEEALHGYFTPQFAAELLRDKPDEEIQRIEDWVAYVRCQNNLTNAAGFLRTKIESAEPPPASVLLNQHLRRNAGPAEGITPESRSPPVLSAESDPIPDLNVPGTSMRSRELWQAALDTLQLQMTRAAFDTWLKGSYVSRVEDGSIVIAVSNVRVKEWLENRFNSLICKTLRDILGLPVKVEFEAVM